MGITLVLLVACDRERILAACARIKRYLSDVKEGRVPQTLWFHADVGHTQDAKKTLLEMGVLENEEATITPKPVALVERVLDIGADDDAIVLDSFAGSGTTAHAVLKANARDGGNRKFILVESEDYADRLTAGACDARSKATHGKARSAKRCSNRR